MELPSPLFTMVADTQMTELGRVRETIHNKYDRKFAAYSTLYMGLSFVQTFPGAENVGNTDCHHDKPVQ